MQLQPIASRHFHFQQKIQLCHQIIRYDLGRTYYKMSISEKIKTIDNKIEQNKAQYNLDRQIAMVSA